MLTPSAEADALERRGAAVEDDRKPWWDGNPQIDAARDEVIAWLESVEDRPPTSEEPDPVVMDIYSGDCRRELIAARDDLDRARARYAEAVRAARVAGWSWGEVGRLLGVTKQSLHRQFRNAVD
jgi:DNA-directed RNA polymerase specialized sigma24 family protein